MVATTTCRMRSLAGEHAGNKSAVETLFWTCMRKSECSAAIVSSLSLRCLRRSCLHHTLYWGHLAVAARLISAGCSLHLPDHQVSTHLRHGERGVGARKLTSLQAWRRDDGG